MALLAALWTVPACSTAKPTPPRYAEVLAGPAVPADVTVKLRPPTGDCLAQARAYLGDEQELVSAPLPSGVHERLSTLLEGLHPAAKQTLRRLDGVWIAENIPNAAAAFLPCNVDAERATGGFVLLDVGDYPLDGGARDVDVPAYYWNALAGSSRTATRRRYSIGSLDAATPTPADHALRYVLTHELGHALSLLAGEFDLDGHTRMHVREVQGFVSFSWRVMTTERRYLPLGEAGSLAQAIVPRRSLDTYEWGSVLAMLDADAARLAPGWALAPLSSERLTVRMCGAIEKLVSAGFVTPTAARFPTEDFAETFAHAVLASEGKIHPEDVITVPIQGCGTSQVPSPYFAHSLRNKRAYVEGMLPLATRGGVASVARIEGN